MDHDRLEVANVVRHLAGVSDIGRFKTKFLAQAIREKNPNAQVRTFQTKIEKSTAELVGQSIARSDLVICLTDNRKSRLIINDLCVRQNKPLILGGAFHRACGGQVLFVRPHVTPCYQCFVQGMPPQARDEEISSAAQARAVAYADRPVPIEPGLSTDIAPISLMVVKLAIQYLLRDQKTTLRSLDEDLVASWYLWINRRDPDTEYRDLEPLEFNLDGFRILRWYGIQLRRHPDCHACGTAPRRDGESAPSDDSGTPSASLLPGG
jgi:molybdopterin/thiamine biosynthesis adenylyltransferase